MSRREHNARKIRLNCSLKVPASSAGESSLQTPNTPNTPEILNTIVNITENMARGPQQPQHPLQIESNLQSDSPSPSLPPFPLAPASPPSLLMSPPPLLVSPSGPPHHLQVPSQLPQLLQSPSHPPHLMSPQDLVSRHPPAPAMLASPLQPPPLILSSPPSVQPPSSISPATTPGQDYSCPLSAVSTPDGPPVTSVKEELKMKVTKNLRRVSGDSLPYPSPGTVSIKRESDDGVADDEEKRRRRRERNKVAAEKCRNKRKKAIEKLYSESESVVVQNQRFKEDIQRLEAEHRHLRMVLEKHKPVCRRNCGVSEGAEKVDTRDLESLNTLLEAEVKQEREDTELYTKDTHSRAGESFEYKYASNSSSDLFGGDSGLHYNFSYTGGYYDTACFAV